MRSTKLWVKAHNPASKWLYIALGLTSIAGLVDATYLTITHYTKALVPCSVTHGCETVLRSSYAEVLGVPIAAFGIVFYLVVLVVSVQSYFSNHPLPTLYPSICTPCLVSVLFAFGGNFNRNIWFRHGIMDGE
jgi:uncharacterized membrane protein